jgi:hypothetical protein
VYKFTQGQNQSRLLTFFFFDASELSGRSFFSLLFFYKLNMTQGCANIEHARVLYKEGKEVMCPL